MMSVVFSVTAGTTRRLSPEMEAAGEGLVETASDTSSLELGSDTTPSSPTSSQVSLDGIESAEPEDDVSDGEREKRLKCWSKRSDAQIAKDKVSSWEVLAWAERQVAAERDAAKRDAAQGHWGGRASVSESRKAMKVPGASPGMSVAKAAKKVRH